MIIKLMHIEQLLKKLAAIRKRQTKSSKGKRHHAKVHPGGKGGHATSNFGGSGDSQA